MTPGYERARADWRARWQVAGSLQRRISQATFLGPGVYITMAIVLLIAAVLVQNDLRFAARNAIYINRQPLAFPILITVIISAVYLALSTALMVTREREQGTLETLFFGPVDHVAFIMGYFLAQMRVYAGLTAVLIVWTALVSWILNLAFSPAIAVLLLSSLLAVAVSTGFSLLVGVWGRRTRTTLIFLVLVLLLVLGLQLADVVVSGIAMATAATANDPLLVIRNVLAAVNRNVITWISPFAQLALMLDALVESAWRQYATHLVIMVAQAALLLATAVWMLRRTGVSA